MNHHKILFPIKIQQIGRVSIFVVSLYVLGFVRLDNIPNTRGQTFDIIHHHHVPAVFDQNWLNRLVVFGIVRLAESFNHTFPVHPVIFAIDARQVIPLRQTPNKVCNRLFSVNPILQKLRRGPWASHPKRNVAVIVLDEYLNLLWFQVKGTPNIVQGFSKAFSIGQTFLQHF